MCYPLPTQRVLGDGRVVSEQQTSEWRSTRRFDQTWGHTCSLVSFQETISTLLPRWLPEVAYPFLQLPV